MLSVKPTAMKFSLKNVSSYTVASSRSILHSKVDWIAAGRARALNLYTQVVGHPSKTLGLFLSVSETVFCSTKGHFAALHSGTALRAISPYLGTPANMGKSRAICPYWFV